jgi:hypothetical protein
MTANSAKRQASFEAAPDAPKADDVRRALDRLLESAAFRDSLRLTSFLKFVVEAVLEGRGNRIKSYTIAVEALGRRAAFDPQADPIVRVEAGRLRQALARYYAATGCNDPVVIEMPRGTYVPTFSWRDAAAAPNASNGVLVGGVIASSAGGGNLADERRKLRDTLAAFHTLAAMHRLQIAAVNREIASARLTLKNSHALLKLATVGLSGEINGTGARQPGSAQSHGGGSAERPPILDTPGRATGPI